MFIRHRPLVVALVVASTWFGCGEDEEEEETVVRDCLPPLFACDDDAESSRSSGGSGRVGAGGGTASSGGGAAGGASSSGGGDVGGGGGGFPCGEDCSLVEAPECFIAICNLGALPGPINSCVLVPEDRPGCPDA
ncbi:MAG: hypothetical protein AAF928_04180 [Myxococcota bacterium]